MDVKLANQMQVVSSSLLATSYTFTNQVSISLSNLLPIVFVAISYCGAQAAIFFNPSPRSSLLNTGRAHWLTSILFLNLKFCLWLIKLEQHFDLYFS